MIESVQTLLEFSKPVKKPRNDLTGQKFKRLTVLNQAGRSKEGQIKWLCRCSCGKEIVTTAGNLRSGHTTSCSCRNKEITKKRSETHGATVGRNPSIEYSTWTSIIGRCENPKNPAFKDYGGRGIKVCARWRDSFEAFLADMGPRPKGMTIDRKENSKGYEPRNCRWATYTEQNNNRRDNVWIEFDGKKMTIAQWGRETGIGGTNIGRRLKEFGWSVARALTEPCTKSRR